jgi:hypothetical protein
MISEHAVFYDVFILSLSQAQRELVKSKQAADYN